MILENSMPCQASKSRMPTSPPLKTNTGPSITTKHRNCSACLSYILPTMLYVLTFPTSALRISSGDYPDSSLGRSPMISSLSRSLSISSTSSTSLYIFLHICIYGIPLYPCYGEAYDGRPASGEPSEVDHIRWMGGSLVCILDNRPKTSLS